MSQPAFPLPGRRIPPFQPLDSRQNASIVEDLRSFARDLGVHGWSAMTKEELVESLRQRYLLDTFRSGPGEAGH
jgi:hypothetical protein